MVQVLKHNAGSISSLCALEKTPERPRLSWLSGDFLRFFVMQRQNQRTFAVIWQIGEFTFDAATNVLEGPGGHRLLEPKPAALLSYFIKNAGRDVSRNELMETVWGAQIVSDGAINRVVVQLRKALGDNEKIKRFIVTVPKVGYRFVAPVEHFTPTVERPVNLTDRKTLRVAVALALAIAAAILIAPPSEVPNGPTSATTPLLRLPGEQFGAAVSENGHIALSVRTERGADLYWMENENSAPTRIGTQGGLATSAAWLPDGGGLIYQYRDSTSCRFHRIVFHAGKPTAPEEIYVCPQSGASSIAASRDGSTLYFTERQSLFAPASLFELDLESGAKQRPPQPLPRGRGNHYVDVHPADGAVLLLSDQQAGQTSAFRLPLDDTTYELLVSWPFRVDFAVWGHGLGTIVHPGGHPSYDLVETDYKTRTERILVSDSRRVTSPKRMAGGQDYLFTSYLYNRDIWLDGAPANALNSSVMDYLPSLSRNGQMIAFVSKRTGESLIWVHNLATGDQRAIALEVPSVSIVGLDWSLDDGLLLATSSQGLWVIDAKESVITHHLRTELPAYGGIWSGPESFNFSQYENGAWSLYTVSLPDGLPERAQEDWAFSLMSNELTVTVDQAGGTWRDGTSRIPVNCTPPIHNRHLTYRINGTRFYCPAADKQGVYEWSPGQSPVHLPNIGGALRQFSFGGERAAHTVETSATSDIMRTTTVSP